MALSPSAMGRAVLARAATVLLSLCGVSMHEPTAASASAVSFDLQRSGTASAGLYRSADGTLVQHVFSGKAMAAGRHTVELDERVVEQAGAGEALELRVVSSSGVKYEWQGVIGNTGPLNGPGALKGLNPPLKIQIVGDRAVWGLGYNERQPSVFSFNLSNPQVCAPVTLDAFDRLYTDFATDGELVYVPNVGFPSSNSYYHMVRAAHGPSEFPHTPCCSPSARHQPYAVSCSRCCA